MTKEIPLPEPFASIPRIPLTLGPSPIHPLQRISTDLSTPTNKVNIYAKRDDLASHLASGGNKTRKLEYILAPAVLPPPSAPSNPVTTPPWQKATTLISIGGLQSNHTRQVAACAAALGLKCSLIQENWVPDANAHSKQYDKVGNIQLSRLLGADVRIHLPTSFGIGHKSTLQELEAELRNKGERPYYIPAGGSDHPLGGLGFARWAFEVAEQEREMGVRFGTVVVCAVTGGTLGGMLAGFKLLERLFPDNKKRVVGIDASAKPAETREQVLRIARATAARIGMVPEDIDEKDVLLVEDYHAGQYGVPDAKTWEAIEYAARMEAFITDPVYEGKSFAGMVDLIRKGEIRGNVLYAHLGGQLALNAYTDVGERK
ncbi:putative 1-aminocyclopropane-1-carboxylate deaminase [Aspergillus homomorphus CBS 101889]|uniref:Putative 1-aminocyclopropane-1-carboxylate deaminase n=1 Tax=Aspergillus homomorphus (strain CBS 101889) TaxID=1450537 RepID=A0A395I2P6_ASPHC|nr:putative 1-aminocyclopropane-1-carboxylate deaminase [Aspergillus homomorphus CBS 101889]RAL14330.1 putative 1-aminocyclopropane-1-carboxylate deaminase [Aspergillus homomorphus CBS 101889]